METIKLRPKLFTVLILTIICISNAQWVEISTGLESKVIRCIAPGENVIFTGVAFKGLYSSTDDGVSWVQTSLNDATVFSAVAGKNKIFAGAESGFYSSTDNGSSWIKVISNVIPYLSSDKNYIIAGGGSSAIHTSTDNGETWVHNYFDGQEVSALCVKENVFYAGTELGLYFSADYGKTWQITSYTKYVSAIAVNGSNIYTGDTKSGLYLSTDNGTSWQHTSLQNRWIYSILAYDNIILAGNFPDGFSVSTDNGTSWTAENTGLKGLIAKRLCIFNNYIFAGTDAGFFRRPISELVKK